MARKTKTTALTPFEIASQYSDAAQTTTERKTRSQAPHQLHKRGFLAAQMNRLTSDWAISPSINTDLREGLTTLRGRSRDLSINNEFARRYFDLVKSNVVGPEGIKVSVQALSPEKTPDRYNPYIEDHFWKWSQPSNCSVDGQLSFRKIQELVLETVARDGEALIWLRRGDQFGRYAFQLQILDPDHLDENYFATLDNGNSVFQGVELNGFGRPVAYHIWLRNPSDTGLMNVQTNNRRIRVPAEDLIHLFDKDRASQTRGYPWIAPAMLQLHQISKYREAELVTARIAALKQVYFKQTQKDASLDYEYMDDVGNIPMEATPGSMEVLPVGFDVTKVDWESPKQGFADFQKSVLKGISVALGVSYATLSSDMADTSYSASRFGALADQDNWRSIQKWFVDMFVKRVWEEWLSMQLLTDSWKLDIWQSKFDKYNNVRFITRSFASVDPQKDANADLLLLNNNLTSHSDIISKSGRDPEEVFAQIAKDKAKLASLGITTKEVITGTVTDDEEEKKPMPVKDK